MNTNSRVSFSQVKLLTVLVIGVVAGSVSAAGTAQPYVKVDMVELSETNPDDNRGKLNQAIIDAKDWFAEQSSSLVNARYLIQLPPGRFEVGMHREIDSNKGVIDFTDVVTRDRTNWIIIRGWGHNPLQPKSTTLVTSVKNHTITGWNSTGIHWEHVHFTKDRMKVSQGKIVTTSTSVDPPHWAVIKLEVGFPSLNDYRDPPQGPEKSYGIFNRTLEHGRKLRIFTNVDSAPRYVRLNGKPGGIVWTDPAKLPDEPGRFDRRWRVTLHDLPRGMSARSLFPRDTAVGIKSKHGGQAYRFFGGSRIRFSHVRWTHESRGLFRNVDRAEVLHSHVGYDPELQNNHFQRVRWYDNSIGSRTNIKPYLSTSAGGPQFGQPQDNVFNFTCYPKYSGCLPLASNVEGNSGGRDHVVMGNRFLNLGDDPVAVFNVGKGVSIKNNRIIGSSAREILSYSTCDFHSHVGIANNTPTSNMSVRRMLNYPGDVINKPNQSDNVAWARWEAYRDSRCRTWRDEDEFAEFLTAPR